MHFQSWPYPVVLAHRGAGTLAPENTLAAMRTGYALGYRAVEYDAMLTADAVPILMHDPFLGRTVAGQGCVADFPWAILQGRDAGAWKAAEFAGEPIPTLVDVIAYCQQQGIWMNVEIKPVPGYETQTGKVVAQTVAKAVAGHDTLALPLLSSFSSLALSAAQQAAPHLPRGALFDVIPANWQQQLETMECVALHCNHKFLTPHLAKAIKAAGYWLFCYTVNRPARAREIQGWGVDAFCTDRLDLFQDYRP
ncbi:glycerophosphodiester phosphodiesterase [Parvibium lacunae]|uniref:Glycerophosphodiester phosphodiesterase n=1 Tax=Parvibium lacunae TaxID=1888893 RepID=A0A368L4L9_9BURK|nr:glycerophosphodiester phosphodiesterase [Parvibium lacunae]RCS58465.1 glycerophosphodiester phosphodiesterase [Parvibium lacunae]